MILAGLLHQRLELLGGEPSLLRGRNRGRVDGGEELFRGVRDVARRAVGGRGADLLDGLLQEVFRGLALAGRKGQAALMVEAERRAYADRAQFMGDADFVKVPVKKLTSDAYIKDRMSDFDPAKAGSSQATPAGKIDPESEETTHLSITDKNGNAVSITTTLNGGYGSKTVVGGAGFLLNNEMDDFSVKPGVPNMYGAVGAEANAIAPGKRMLSSMTPAIVLKNNKPYIVLGTPGGTTIPTSVFQTLVNMLDFGMAPTEAINQPKFHHQWQPDEVAVEKDFPAAVVAGLKAMGYKIAVRNGIGRTEVVKIVYNASGKATIDAAGDKRGDDSVEGF